MSCFSGGGIHKPPFCKTCLAFSEWVPTSLENKNNVGVQYQGDGDEDLNFNYFNDM